MPVKRSLVILMNCHGREVGRYLASHPVIREQYEITTFVTYLSADDAAARAAIEAAVAAADVVICQNVKSIPWLRNEALRALTGKGCAFLPLEFWRCNGFWPIPLEPFSNWLKFPPDDAPGRSFAEYIAHDPGRTWTFQHFDRALDTFREVDALSEIPMFDYFVNNYRSDNLFTEHFHPTSLFFLELCRRILRWLGLSDAIGLLPNDAIGADSYRLILDPVAETLGLRFDRTLLHFHDTVIDRQTYFEFARHAQRQLPPDTSYEAALRAFYAWAADQGMRRELRDVAGLGRQGRDPAGRAPAEIDLGEIRDLRAVTFTAPAPLGPGLEAYGSVDGVRWERLGPPEATGPREVRFAAARAADGGAAGGSACLRHLRVGGGAPLPAGGRIGALVEALVHPACDLSAPRPGGPVAAPLRVDSPQDCFFTHTIELPGHGLMRGEWDARGRVESCLGHVDVAGKRVLDIGCASGFLSFELEARGAEIVSLDIPGARHWDVVPFPELDGDAALDLLGRHLDAIRRAYWLSHRALGSRARYVQGTAYAIPAEVGPVDVALLGSVLPHLRDPFRALHAAARIARDSLIVIEVAPRRRWPFGSPDRPPAFLPRASRPDRWESWWRLAPGTIREMLAVLGFADAALHRHRLIHAGRPRDCTTLVAHRTAPTNAAFGPD
ncbi:class I SAM-dependent methyltransferase [Methylobacterium sp. WSM2598]|uniref:class I SAM-dependent methyltransferase n=1 Tax=Methylobacterium sp. WSM2598 TaxID=398261 RepID=UPI000379FD30|nr:methyltransferase domain-containing protein [Methylobacterium sp. WSM2598]